MPLSQRFPERLEIVLSWYNLIVLRRWAFQQLTLNCESGPAQNNKGKKGGPAFHFVSDGIHAALERAVGAANGQDVRLGRASVYPPL